MRITTSMIFSQLTRSLQKNIEDLALSNSRISSGKRIEKPSDDVIAAMKSMDYKLNINYNEQYRRNIDEVVSHLSFTENIAASASESLIRIKELAVSGASAGYSTGDRAAMAKEVSAVRGHLLSLSNSKFRDRYVFSGFRTDIQSFDSNFNYQGDSGIINVLIDRDAVMPINFSGLDVFSYSFSGTEVIQMGDNLSASYTVSGNTINVKILDSGGSVIDSFSFSNFMELTGLLSSALENDNIARIQALMKPIDRALQQTADIQAVIGARLNHLDAQLNRLDDRSFNLRTVLSNAEDADIAEAVSDAARAEIALQSLRQLSARVLPQSLLDFLR